jgi:phosphate uptake regulator
MPSAHPPKEKRKVQISGKSSCMISLPKRWVKEMGLVQGSPLTISRHNSTSLLISVDKTLGGNLVRSENDVGTLYISKPEPPETVLRKVVCLYVQGYNMIRVRFSENSTSSFLKSTIRELVRRQLIGVEIVSDTSDGLVLQILLGKSELTIDNAMKRMSIVTSTILEDAIAGLRFFDKRRARDAVEKDEIERFGSYTSRQILGSINHDFFKEGDDSEPEKLAVYLMIARAVENIAGCARDIGEQTLRLDSALDSRSAENLGKIGVSASEIFDSAILSFFKRDSKTAESTLEKAREFMQLVGIALDGGRQNSTDRIIAIVGVIESMKSIVRHSTEMANLVLALTPDQYVRTEVISNSPLLMERDQVNVFT